MWVLKRVREDANTSTDSKSHYLIVGEYLVGRKGCQIQIAGDQTVSRKHACITVHLRENTKNNETYITIKDISKFGSNVNGVKCENLAVIELNDGDLLTFGTQNSQYRLSHEPLVVFASCLQNAKKKILKFQIQKLGGYMVSEWQKECTHLVMDALSFTVKVIYALASCCRIVKTSYFDDLLQQITSNGELPMIDRYMPPIKEELIDPNLVSFSPNEARKSIFNEKLFLFLDQKQYKRMEGAVILAGGKAMVEECGNVDDGIMDGVLTDTNTLVISEDLKSQISSHREAWIGHVGDVLTSCNRRPIAETEIGLAILYLSLNEHCNSSINHVPRITKHIVSKSLSTMEAISQRVNESQNITIASQNVSNKHNELVTESVQGRKRSRASSNEGPSLVDDTPLAKETPSDNKRQKLSPSNGGTIKDNTILHQNVTEKRNDDSKCNRTHVSQSENINDTVMTHRNTSEQSRLNITHLPQSEDLDSFYFKASSKKAQCSHSRIDRTHVSQSEGFTILSSDKKRRRKLSNSEEVSSHDCSINICETPTPDMLVKKKRLRISDNDCNITHVSQTERFSQEHLPSRSPTEVLFDFDGSFTFHQPKEPKPIKVEHEDIPLATGTVVNSGEIKTEKQDDDILNEGSNHDSHQKRIKVEKDETEVAVEEVTKESAVVKSEESYVPESPEHVINEGSGSGYGGGSGTGDNGGYKVLASGWMSKRSQRTKATTHRRDEDDNMVDKDGNTVKKTRNTEEKNSIKNSEVTIKQEYHSQLPRDVLRIEYTELVVVKDIAKKNRPPSKKHSITNLKNTKRFRKQRYVGGDGGLPRIIGGSDLMVFTSKNKDVQDWFQDFQQKNSEQDKAEREADNLFNYDPPKKKSKKRRL